MALNSHVTLRGADITPGLIKYHFSSPDEAILAVERGGIDYQDHVRIQLNGTLYDTSAGRVMSRRIVQEALGTQGHLIDQLVNLHTAYEKIAARHDHDLLQAARRGSHRQTARRPQGQRLQAVDHFGHHHRHRRHRDSPVKDAILADADLKLREIEQNYEFGFMTEEERYKQVVQLWNDTTDEVKNEVFKNFEANYPFNPLWIMSQSGARGNPQQIRQLAGMRGLMARPDGSTIEVPIKASFREGLTVLEYFISTHGARKGGADTALRTADSGYLTRKLVDVAHEVVVRDVDCGTTDYTIIPMGHVDERSGEWRARKASEIETSIYGRTLTADVEMTARFFPKATCSASKT